MISKLYDFQSQNQHSGAFPTLFDSIDWLESDC